MQSIELDDFPALPERKPKQSEKLAAAVAAGLQADRARYEYLRRTRPALYPWLRPTDRPEMLGLMASMPVLIPGVKVPASARAVVRINPQPHGFTRTLVTVDRSYWNHAVRAAAGGRLYEPTAVHGYDFTLGGMPLDFVSVRAGQ